MSDPGPWQPPAPQQPVAPPPPAAAPPLPQQPPQYGERLPAWPPPPGAPVPPGAPAAPGPYGQPQFGQPQYGQQPYAPNPYGQQPYPGAAPAGWTPPPKPGLIPLRPLTLGDILGGAFQVLRRNPRPTFGFALLISLGANILVTLLIGGVTFLLLWRTQSATGNDADTIIAGSVLIGVLVVIATAMLSAAITALVQGIVALEVVRGALGDRHTLGGLWRAAKGRMGAFIGWTLLVLAAVLLILIILSLIVVAVFLAAGEIAGVVAIVILSLVTLLGGIVLGYWLSTKLAFVPAAILVERRSIRDAVARSWRLTRGFFWRILGITLLVAVILGIVSQVVTAPISFLGGFAQVLVNPNGDAEASVGFVIVLMIVSLALSTVVTAITLVAQSAVPALLYLDVRMRSEGLDLELQRWVEDRAAGQPVPENPYLPADRHQPGNHG